MSFLLLNNDLIRQVLSFVSGKMLCGYYRHLEDPRGMFVAEHLKVIFREGHADIFTIPPTYGANSLDVVRILTTISLVGNDKVEINGLDKFAVVWFEAKRHRGKTSLLVQYDYLVHRGRHAVLKKYCHFEVRNIFETYPIITSKAKMVMDQMCTLMTKGLRMHGHEGFLEFGSINIPVAAYAASVALSTRRSPQPLGGPFATSLEGATRL